MYTCELVRNFKRARQTFQCIFRYSDNLPDCPGKRTAQKMDITLKNMQHFLQPRFLGNMLRKVLAYRFSKLACGGGSVYQGKIQCILPQQCQQTRQIFKNENKTATATQLMHVLRYKDTCQLSYDKHLSTA